VHLRELFDRFSLATPQAERTYAAAESLGSHILLLRGEVRFYYDRSPASHLLATYS
jgi:hypothetical protein